MKGPAPRVSWTFHSIRSNRETPRCGPREPKASRVRYLNNFFSRVGSPALSFWAHLFITPFDWHRAHLPTLDHSKRSNSRACHYVLERQFPGKAPKDEVLVRGVRHTQIPERHGGRDEEILVRPSTDSDSEHDQMTELTTQATNTHLSKRSPDVQEDTKVPHLNQTARCRSRRSRPCAPLHR